MVKMQAIRLKAIRFSGLWLTRTATGACTFRTFRVQQGRCCSFGALSDHLADTAAIRLVLSRPVSNIRCEVNLLEREAETLCLLDECQFLERRFAVAAIAGR